MKLRSDHDAAALERLHAKMDYLERTQGEIMARIGVGPINGDLPIEVLTPSTDFYTSARGAFTIYGPDQHGGPVAEQYIIRMQALAARISAVERAHRCTMKRWTPVDMALRCPHCGMGHIDAGIWRVASHRTHLCAFCETKWRPFEYPTVGV